MPPPLTPEEREGVLARNRALRDTEKSFRSKVREMAGRDEHMRRMKVSMEEQHLRRCPVLAADEAEENKIGCGVELTATWLKQQIVEAFTNAGKLPSVEPSIIASRLLKSHDYELCVDLAAFAPLHANVHRLYAHIEALGILLPPSVMGSLARRLFVAIVNRDAPKLNGKSDMEFCANCGESFPRGERCGCPT
jgi:hypothetical protein